MATRGLTRERVVDAAAALIDAGGLDALSLAAVADAVGVRTPSLYNHVDGLTGLRRDLSLHGVRLLGERLAAADADLRTLAHAYRDFATSRPGLYAATVRAPGPDDVEHRAAAAAVVDVVVAALGPHGLEGEAAIHATRGLRSLLHGFTAIELAGGFGLDTDVEASFEWMIEAFATGLDDART